MKNDVVMDGMNVSIEAVNFSQKVVGYLRNLLPEDQKYFVDIACRAAFLSSLSAHYARSVYCGTEWKTDIDVENDLCDYHRELNEMREKFGMLKGEREHDDGCRIHEYARKDSED